MVAGFAGGGRVRRMGRRRGGRDCAWRGRDARLLQRGRRRADGGRAPVGPRRPRKARRGHADLPDGRVHRACARGHPRARGRGRLRADGAARRLRGADGDHEPRGVLGGRRDERAAAGWDGEGGRRMARRARDGGRKRGEPLSLHARRRVHERMAHGVPACPALPRQAGRLLPGLWKRLLPELGEAGRRAGEHRGAAPRVRRPRRADIPGPHPRAAQHDEGAVFPVPRQNLGGPE